MHIIIIVHVYNYVLTFRLSPSGLVKAVGIVAGIEKPITSNTTTIDTTTATNNSKVHVIMSAYVIRLSKRSMVCS